MKLPFRRRGTGRIPGLPRLQRLSARPHLPTRTLTLALGTATDAAIGDPPTRLHPVGLIGLVVRNLERRAPHSPDARGAYGMRVAMALPAGAAALSWLVVRLVGRRRPLMRLAAEASLFSTTVALRTLLARAEEVEAALARGDLESARSLLGTHLVSRDSSTLDSAGVAAAAIESVAENLSDGVVAPQLAFALGGLPAAVAYRAVNTLDAMWGYREPPFEQLGAAAARLDDLCNLAPARLTAAALVLAAATVPEGDGYDAGRAFRVWQRDAAATASPNAGHPMAAMAGALGVELTKHGAYALGAGLRQPEARDIGRAVRLARHAAQLAFGGLLGLTLARELRR